MQQVDRIPCETYYYRIASSIRKSRQEKGMTQEKLAEAAGISLKMVQKLEGGQKGFRMETIIRVSQALDIPFVCFAGMQGEDEETIFWREMFHKLVRDKTVEEVKYAVGIVDSVFKLHKKYLE